MRPTLKFQRSFTEETLCSPSAILTPHVSFTNVLRRLEVGKRLSNWAELLTVHFFSGSVLAGYAAMSHWHHAGTR